METNQQQERKWCVYIHTNKINGKIYIGQTSKKPEYRWREGKGYAGCTHFYNAIQKYGWENFDHKILYDNLTPEEANNLEEALIAEYDSTNSNIGYNLRSGGENSSVSDETKKKMSQAHKGEHRSKKTREKISEARKGKKFTEQHIKNLSESHKGNSIPEETRKRMSEAQRKRFSSENPAESQRIPVLCVETNIVYYSIGEAERQTGISHSSIIRCCKGKAHAAGGYHWEYYKGEQ